MVEVLSCPEGGQESLRSEGLTQGVSGYQRARLRGVEVAREAK